MARMKKAALFVGLVLVLYTVIVHPARASGLVRLGFEGVSDAARGTGEFVTALLR